MVVFVIVVASYHMESTSLGTPFREPPPVMQAQLPSMTAAQYCTAAHDTLRDQQPSTLLN